MALISDMARCEMAKWLARAILTTITWTNILASLLAVLHAVSIFTSTYGCSVFGHHVVATQTLLLALMEKNQEDMDKINTFQLKVKVVLMSTILQMVFHGTVIRLNWRLFRCYDFNRADFFTRMRTWWWLQMCVISMTLWISVVEQIVEVNSTIKQFEEVFYTLRRSYSNDWQLLVFDVASLCLIKWYSRIMCYVRMMHRLYLDSQ